ncbi:TIGR03086 family metal-binding protein [Dactylosporangium salmoneum]|uniref:Mycothiol-dependent maleylpyruvate isomerase metal-binding domain-containing protein n=1 Tax=Dactylosporangium salmoneum TaxID=53361 RepID=A0ABN3I5T6_9ACTN
MIDRIDAAIDMTTAVVAGLGPQRLGEPSLCPGWSVRDELNHLVGGVRIFAAQLSGGEAGRDHEDDWLGDDPAGAFKVAAELDRAAWHRPDALDGTVRLGFGEVPRPMAANIHLTEVLVHGADLAVVGGREDLVDQRLCEGLLATMRSMDMTPFRRPGMFGPERPAPADAPAHRRLLAYLGREL